MSFAHFIFFGSSSPCGRERIQAEEVALRCRSMFVTLLGVFLEFLGDDHSD
jgi:hypothetical protein